MKRKGDRPLMKAVSQIKNKDDLPWVNAPKAHRHVLLILMSYANINTSECFPGLERLSKDSGWSRTKIISVLCDLRRWGYVTKIEQGSSGDRPGKRRADVYRLNEEVIWAVVKDLCEINPAGKQFKNSDKQSKKSPVNSPATEPQETSEETIYQETHPQAGGGGRRKGKEQGWLMAVTAFGLNEEAALSLLRKHDINRLESALNEAQSWRNVRDPKAAFLSCLKKTDVQVGRLPHFQNDHDASLLQAWAIKNGLPEAGVGETPDQYRRRIHQAYQSKGDDFSGYQLPLGG